jgi:tRNA (Thr-GGU) A37 N-methylase
MSEARVGLEPIGVVSNPVTEARDVRRPRDRSDMPALGIFAQRARYAAAE